MSKYREAADCPITCGLLACAQVLYVTLEKYVAKDLACAMDPITATSASSVYLSSYFPNKQKTIISLHIAGRPIKS